MKEGLLVRKEGTAENKRGREKGRIEKNFAVFRRRGGRRKGGGRKEEAVLMRKKKRVEKCVKEKEFSRRVDESGVGPQKEKGPP